MPKKLNEKEKLGLGTIADLKYLFEQIDWNKTKLDPKAIDIVKTISIKIKLLALMK